MGKPQFGECTNRELAVWIANDNGEKRKSGRREREVRYGMRLDQSQAGWKCSTCRGWTRIGREAEGCKTGELARCSVLPAF